MVTRQELENLSTGIASDAIGSNVEGSPHLQNSYHPGMILVTNSLTGNNYLSWSRAMKIALGAKMKLGFIDGRCSKPAATDLNFDKWCRADYTNELEERYGECNGPLLYQLKRDICSISQGDLSISKYYTKLKKLWDELACLAPIPRCDCGAAIKMVELDSNDTLMQFLMGLNDAYDHVRNQILVMDPLPNISKAYSMILRVENQKKVHVNLAPDIDTAMFVKNSAIKSSKG